MVLVQVVGWGSGVGVVARLRWRVGHQVPLVEERGRGAGTGAGAAGFDISIARCCCGVVVVAAVVV